MTTDTFEEQMFGLTLPRISRKPRRKRPEAKVQAEIVRCLVADLGAVVAVTDAGILARMGLNMRCGIPEGWPDITACLPNLGQFLGVECKAKNGRQSPAQKRMQERIEANGGLYILAHSFDEFKAAWDAHLPAID